MTIRGVTSAALVFCLTASAALAQPKAPVLPPGDKEPVLRLEAGGPTTFVTSLAFSADGQTLYGAGFDKIVRVWKQNAKGQFDLDQFAYRVPVGPGTQGSINGFALSPDGNWLAVGGLGIMRGTAGFRQWGLVVSNVAGLTPEMRRDQGTIYVFNTRTGAVRPLRGHMGPVWSLAFAPAQQGKTPLLVSIAREWNDEDKSYTGSLRVWNVDSGEQVAVGGCPQKEIRPGITVWRTGEQAKQIRVAFAWDDNILRVWDVDKNELWEKSEVTMKDPAEDDNKKVSSRNITVMSLPGQNQLLTGSYRGDGTGKLQLWNVPDGRGPAADPQLRVNFPPEDDKKTHLYPRALCLLSSRPGGRPDHAAVVLRALARNNEYRLNIIDLNPDNFGAIKADIALWHGSADVPTVTAAPGGKHLAVAGNKDHQIYVFNIQDLLAKRGEPQKLQSVGVPLHYVSFLSKGNDVGLLLNETGKKARGGAARKPIDSDLVFDFTRRVLTDNKAGWNVDAPNLQGWQATKDADSQTVIVSQGGNEVQRIALKKNQIVTEYAVLPPTPPFKVPLLAVAYYMVELGQPMLSIYNAESGDEIRHLTAHEDPIRCLAFSSNGKLLASVADDQTVCVWSLTNLDKFLGQFGKLHGVAAKIVRDGEERKLVVSQVDESSPAAGKLAKDDVIEGIVEGDKLKTFDQVTAFYAAITEIKPGQAVTLKIQGKGNVKLVVGQGVDERKPLLSLFVTRDRKEWVGWSPLGPYESSEAKAERHIGWHFNTGRPEAPTSFALADEYRKQYYKEGILRHLVAAGTLSGALKTWETEDKAKKLPKPKMTMWIDEVGPDPRKIDGQGQVLVQRSPVVLKLAVDDFPLDKAEMVGWQVQGNAAAFPAVDGRELTADLTAAKAIVKPGIYRVRVTMRTLEAEPQTFTKQLTVRYQPPPVVQLDPAWLKKLFGDKPPQRLVERDSTAPLPQLVVKDDPKFLIEGEVRPGLEGQKMKVTLQQGDKKVALDSKIKQVIELQPGENVIEIKAEAEDALPGFEEFETDRKTLLVTYIPAKVMVPPPQVTLDSLVPVAPKAEPLAVELGQAIVVNEPKVRLRGTISAKENLETLTRDKKALANFKPDNMKEFSLDEELDLKPGRQEFVFQAKTKNSAAAQVTLVLEYRPQLPRIPVVNVMPGKQVFFEGEDPQEVELAGSLLMPSDPQPFKATLLLNDKELMNALKIDDKARTLSAKVKLVPGENRIQIKLSNEWKVTDVQAETQLNYLRPPHALQFVDAKFSDDPFADFVATVQSALPLLKDKVEAEVNGNSIVGAEIEQDAEKKQTWRIKLKGVALEPGKNVVKLLVANEDGVSRKPGLVTVPYNPPPKPKLPPVVELLDPAKDTNVTDPEMTVRFRVKSESDLKRVALVREEGVVVRQEFDLAKLKKNAQGYFELKSDLRLVPRNNRIRVEAVNDGGEQRASVVVNYLHMPVRLAIDKIEPKNQEGQPILPQVLPDGKLKFQTLPTGKVTVQGKVTWAKEDDDQLKKVTMVRVRVNGFQQIPAELKLPKGESRERTFEADLLLNSAEKNQVEIELPVQADSNNRREFQVDCKQPDKGQRLHVLVVGVGEKDEKKLTEQILQAVQARANTDGQIKAPSFEQVRLYGPLTDFVSPDQVFTQLCLIKKTIDVRASADAPRDVMMVYYNGMDAINEKGTYLETSVSAYDKELNRSSITIKGLQNFFAEALGAHLLFLDTERDKTVKAPTAAEEKDEIAHWPANSSVGVVRYQRKGLPNAPDEARLLPALKDATSKETTLRDIVNQVAGKFIRTSSEDKTLVSSQFSQELTMNANVPNNLERLSLGKTP